jgi:methionyl-tRNA formyltransferase
MKGEKITVLVDNESWILPYAERLVRTLKEMQYQAELARSADAIECGWINFLLGCTQIITEEALSRNQHNLVVHESGLPKGRGFAPMTWQILEGKDNIPICLIEAATEVDAGDIWLQDIIDLDGSELVDEWRPLQGEKTIELCLRFVNEYKNMTKSKQSGLPSYYKRRRPADTCLDLDKSLREQFNLLRIADNIRYPAFFEIDGHRYIVNISKDKKDAK